MAARLDRLSIGPALAFLAIGIFLADDVLGAISFAPESGAIRVLAEATLTLLLFVDASTIRARALAHDIGPVSRLLAHRAAPDDRARVPSPPSSLFPGIPLGLAVLIGSTLAPTDAALGQAVVTNQAVPARIRRLLNVESGLNDGIATPFVVLGIALTVAEGGGTRGSSGGQRAGVGVVVGLVAGYVGGRLLKEVDRRAWTSPVSRQLFVLALAASCYLVAVGVGGNGFIAAFVGGLAFGSGTRGAEHEAVRFTELQGSLLAIGVWIAFGLTIAGHILTEGIDPTVLVYAALSLTLIRMVPVAVALIGSRFALPTVVVRGLVRTARDRVDRLPHHRPRRARGGGRRVRAIRRGRRLDGASVRGPARPVGGAAGRLVRTPDDGVGRGCPRARG